MKRLYVGCRVRILWSNSWPELTGKEGRVVEAPVGQPNCMGRPCAKGRADSIPVAPDCWGTPVAPYPGLPINGRRYSWFGPTAEQLEPIQDPGHEVISWEEMRGLWQPEGEVA